MDLTGDSVDREAVGAVGSDLELEHVGGDRQHAVQRCAGYQPVVVEDHDPGVLGADRDLVLGQDHPVRLLAAELGDLEPGAVGHHGAGLGDRDRLAGGHVRGAADDLARLIVTGIDDADAEPVGVWVAAGLEHATDDEVLQGADAMVLDPLDLGPGHRQPLGERVRVELRAAVLVQPVDRDPHRQNCSSIRMSLSYSSRRSGTPCLSIAIRSIPIPNANP